MLTFRTLLRACNVPIQLQISVLRRYSRFFQQNQLTWPLLNFHVSAIVRSCQRFHRTSIVQLYFCSSHTCLPRVTQVTHIMSLPTMRLHLLPYFSMSALLGSDNCSQECVSLLQLCREEDDIICCVSNADSRRSIVPLHSFLLNVKCTCTLITAIMRISYISYCDFCLQIFE